jgi:uncharacterized membrane protein YjgN (DUF898 family)
MRRRRSLGHCLHIWTIAVSQPQIPFAHHGGTGAMIRLALVNLALNIVTFSLWRFWGKTRIRRTLWGGTCAWGDPAEYTGTGRELFLGFIVVLVAVFLPVAIAVGALQVLLQAGNAWAGAGIAAMQLFIIFLAAAGLYRARRYQMSRTLWRGIRGGQSGAAWRYAAMMLGMLAASAATLGWAWPWGEMKLARYRLNNTTFGDCNFTCDARSKPLYGRFAAVWGAGILFFAGLSFGSIMLVFANDHTTPVQMAVSIAAFYVLVVVWGFLTLAVPYARYRAAFWRELAAHTQFADTGFALDATTGSLIKLALGNWLISVASLGVLRPVAALRTFRYACARLAVTAEPDWTLVAQSPAATQRLGEGLAAVFDGAGEF